MFCCYGCELAAGIRAQGREDNGQLYGVLCFTAILSMVVMMLSLFLYAEDVFDMSSDVEMAWMRSAYRWASLVLSTPVMALAGIPLLMRARRKAMEGRPSMEGLIALGAFAAYGLSFWAMVAGRTAVYFETATTALSLATFGRYVEATARSQASRSLGPLVEISQGLVRLLDPDGTVRTVPASSVTPGMMLEVAAETVVPVDIELLDDGADVDLAVLTGESRPVTLTRGDVVPAGAVPAGRCLQGRALRASKDSALERLATLARGLGDRTSKGLQWADRLASYLVPAACGIAVAAFSWWTVVDCPGRGLVAGLAVLLAACPCAYAIASPLVYWLVLRRAFGRGVLLRSADCLEALAATRTVAFDKTATLTRPDLAVVGLWTADGVPVDEVRGLVRAMEDGSSHPVARALARHVETGPALVLRDRRFVPGRGVEAVDEQGRPLFLGAGADGNPTLMRGAAVLARFDIAEELRPEAKETVDQLKNMGLKIVMLSGDATARVETVGATLGIETHGALRPEDKVARLVALGDGTAMVGDGINDAPSLAGRLTSFTLKGGAPLAKGIAQVTLTHDDLRLIPWTLELARRGVTLVRRLLICATLYNVVFVGLAAAGTLKPVWAGLSMLTSSLLSLAFASGVGESGLPYDWDGHSPAQLPGAQEVPCRAP